MKALSFPVFPQFSSESMTMISLVLGLHTNHSNSLTAPKTNHQTWAVPVPHAHSLLRSGSSCQPKCLPHYTRLGMLEGQRSTPHASRQELSCVASCSTIMT